MAAELSYRHTATGSTLKATIRQQLTTGGKIRMWQTAGTPGWEDLTVANWANYVLTMTETPASSYGYVGTWPAGLTTVGWYIVDYYDGATIAGTLAATMLGYWNGTNFLLGGADVREVGGTAIAKQYIWIGDAGTSSYATLGCYLLNGVTPAALPAVGDTLLVDDATVGFVTSPAAGTLATKVIVTFNGSTINGGTVRDGAIFRGDSINSGTVRDGATFSDNSYNTSTGTVGDGALLDTNVNQGGTFTGRVLLRRPCDISAATITGPITYGYDTQAATAGTVDARLAAYNTTGVATAAALAVTDAVADAIKLKTDTIGSGRVTYASTVAEAALATIWAGDDYRAADGTQFSITVTDYAGPSLATATAVLRIMDSAKYLSEVAGVSVEADLEVAATIAIDGTTITLAADLTAAETAVLDTSPPAAARNYIYEFVCTLANTHVGYRTHGQLTVKKAIS